MRGPMVTQAAACLLGSVMMGFLEELRSWLGQDLSHGHKWEHKSCFPFWGLLFVVMPQTQ